MLGGCALVDADGFGKIADRPFALHDQAENAQTVGIGQGLEEVAGFLGGAVEFDYIHICVSSKIYI